MTDKGAKKRSNLSHKKGDESLRPRFCLNRYGQLRTLR